MDFSLRLRNCRVGVLGLLSNGTVVESGILVFGVVYATVVVLLIDKLTFRKPENIGSVG